MYNKEKMLEFMARAELVSKQSEHPTMKVGCCALDLNLSDVIMTGFNRAPHGQTIDWANEKARHKRVVHAERSCMKNCEPNTIGALVCTIAPCADCLVDAADLGVKTIVYGKIYQYETVSLAFDIAKDFNVQMIDINNL